MVHSRIGRFRVIIATMLFCSLGLLFWLTRNYQNTRPTSPNEQAGIIYPTGESHLFI